MFFTGAMFNLEIELFDFHHPASLLTKRRRNQTVPTKCAVVGPQEERATEEVDRELPELSSQHAARAPLHRATIALLDLYEPRKPR